MNDLAARDMAHVWHPFTQHHLWPDEPPLVIARGEGVWLYDDTGARYLDGVSSLWATVHGHREPAIDDAVRAQLDRMAHSTFLGLTHEPGIALAEDLLATAPRDLTRVFYAGDGSSAVEAALKMAYQSAHQRGEDRPLFAHVEHGYHGDTLGAVSVGGIQLFHGAYRPLLLETRMVSSPGVRRDDQIGRERADEVLAELSTLLTRDGPRTCAVIVEPMVQAAGGMLVHDAAFLVGVRALCDEHGILMVADEVATGIGRTGRMWAVEHAGVSPDLLVCGKGLTGGYLPLSAVVAREEVYAAFLGRHEQFRTFFHGHTYTANPLACAAARANLELIAQRNTVTAAAETGERIGTLLEPVAKESGVVEVRRCGTMTGIEIGPFDPALRAGWRVCRRARDQGVLIRPLGDVVVLMPPLGIGAADTSLLVEVTADCVRAVLSELS